MTRRDYLALGLVLLPAACSRAKRTGYAGYALIATAGENSLAVVDLTTFQLTKKIPLPSAPSAVVPEPGGQRSFVLTPASDEFHVVDRDLLLKSTHRLAEGIVEIRLFPESRALLAIANRSKQLIQVDTGSLKIARRFSLPAEPVTFDVSRNGLAAISTGMAIEFIDIATGQRRHFDTGRRVGQLRFRGDGQVLLAANPDDRLITAIDIATQKTIAELPLAMQPDQLCFNADQGQLFVTGKGMDGVAIVFPYNVIEVEQTVLAGRNPGAMATSGTPDYLFVASAEGTDVSIVNVATRKMIGAVDVGGQPGFMAVTPDDRFALVLNHSGDLAVIHIPAIRANRAKSGTALFTMLGIGAKPVHLAVIPKAAGTGTVS